MDTKYLLTMLKLGIELNTPQWDAIAIYTPVATIDNFSQKLL